MKKALAKQPDQDRQAQIRRDYLAGTNPPYFGLICDEVCLRCLIEGVVPSRLMAQAEQWPSPGICPKCEGAMLWRSDATTSPEPSKRPAPLTVEQFRAETDLKIFGYCFGHIDADEFLGWVVAHYREALRTNSQQDQTAQP
jgi:hypothetical protein